MTDATPEEQVFYDWFYDEMMSNAKSEPTALRCDVCGQFASKLIECGGDKSTGGGLVPDDPVACCKWCARDRYGVSFRRKKH